MGPLYVDDFENDGADYAGYTTWLSNISNDKLVMVAMTTTAIVNATEFVDESIVKLKRVMIEEIPLP